MNVIKIFFICLSLGISSIAQTPEWIKYFSGPGNIQESIVEVVYDSSGNAYFSGYGFYTAGGQGTDFITIKCDSNGNQLWANVFNGMQNGSDRPNGIVIDNTGNTYVTGRSRWNSSDHKIVILKYSSSGNLLWRTVYDSLGSSEGEPSDIAIDGYGNILVTGRISPLNNSYYDLITLKLNSDGNVIYQSLFGQVTNQIDFGEKIIANTNGDVFAAGYSFGGLSTGNEVILIKYNQNLTIDWVKHINGTDSSLNEFAIDLCVDDTGNVYLLSSIQNKLSSTDFALIKFDSSGQQIWRVEYDEATINDNPEDMYLDNEGNIYVAGSVRNFGYYNFIVIKYNNAGVEQWKSYYDGGYDDLAVALTVDENKNVYVCGEINPNAGSYFKFNVVKYNPNGNYEWNYLYDVNASSKAIGLFVNNSGSLFVSGFGKNPNGNQDFMTVKISSLTEVDEENTTPKEFTLFQNYPNPFNPSTKISWQSSVSGHKTLKVYDVLGNEVATIVDEYKLAGGYEVDFNAGSLSSGVYFYKLQAGSFTETKKMILLR